MTERRTVLRRAAFGDEIGRLMHSWRALTICVAGGLVVLAIASLVNHHDRHAVLFFALAFGVLVLVAAVAAFDWPWLTVWLYRASLPLNVAIIFVLGNINDTARIVLAVVLFCSAFFAGLFAGRHEDRNGNRDPSGDQVARGRAHDGADPDADGAR